MSTSTSNKVTKVIVDEDPAAYEAKHVHEVYDQIASHFSSTRYKPWPIIATFLSSIPTGWVGLDSGTGNGKYLPLPLERPGSIWTIGLDRSQNLLEAARVAGIGTVEGETKTAVLREVVWGDVLGKGWRNGAFDYAISIATIHHLANHERRRLAVQRLLESVNPEHGRILIYVWAIEQDELSKRSIPETRPETEEPDPTEVQSASERGQDVFVPWVLTSSKPREGSKTNRGKDKNRGTPVANGMEEPAPKRFERYYHMFAAGELVNLASEAIKDMGLVIGTGEEIQDGLRETKGVEIVQDGWERSNYFVELRRWCR